MTISNKKEQSRFDNKSGYDIIKIIRKKIDVSEILFHLLIYREPLM